MNRNQQSNNQPNTPTKDLYALLEISKTANDDEIKRAYKKAALKHHPDRNPDNNEAATAKFQEISNAFKTLSTRNDFTFPSFYGDANAAEFICSKIISDL